MMDHEFQFPCLILCVCQKFTMVFSHFVNGFLASCLVQFAISQCLSMKFYARYWTNLFFWTLFLLLTLLPMFPFATPIAHLHPAPDPFPLAITTLLSVSCIYELWLIPFMSFPLPSDSFRSLPCIHWLISLCLLVCEKAWLPSHQNSIFCLLTLQDLTTFFSVLPLRIYLFFFL